VSNYVIVPSLTYSRRITAFADISSSPSAGFASAFFPHVNSSLCRHTHLIDMWEKTASQLLELICTEWLMPYRISPWGSYSSISGFRDMPRDEVSCKVTCLRQQLYYTTNLRKKADLHRPTQPSIPPGSVNDYQLRLERQV